MIREQRLRLAGATTRALEVEPAAESGAAPIVLLHGWSDSAETWRALWEPSPSTVTASSPSTCPASAARPACEDVA